jgi:hypothetical protein
VRAALIFEQCCRKDTPKLNATVVSTYPQAITVVDARGRWAVYVANCGRLEDREVQRGSSARCASDRRRYLSWAAIVASDAVRAIVLDR